MSQRKIIAVVGATGAQGGGPTYLALGFPGAENLGNMFQFKRDFESYFCSARSLAESRALNPALQTFDQWLAANRPRIPLPSGSA